LRGIGWPMTTDRLLPLGRQAAIWGADRAPRYQPLCRSSVEAALGLALTARFSGSWGGTFALAVSALSTSRTTRHPSGHRPTPIGLVPPGRDGSWRCGSAGQRAGRHPTVLSQARSVGAARSSHWNRSVPLSQQHQRQNGTQRGLGLSSNRPSIDCRRPVPLPHRCVASP